MSGAETSSTGRFRCRALAIGAALVTQVFGLVLVSNLVGRHSLITDGAESLWQTVMYVAAPAVAMADLGLNHAWVYLVVLFIALLFLLWRFLGPLGGGRKSWLIWVAANGVTASLYGLVAHAIIRAWPLPAPCVTPFESQPKEKAEFLDWYRKGVLDAMFGFTEFGDVLGWTSPQILGYRSGHHAGKLVWQRGTGIAKPERVTPQGAAVCRGDFEWLDHWLTEPGARIHEVDGTGRTVLHVVCYSGFDMPDLIRRLLARGAAVNQPDKGGRTPLYLAAQRGRLDVVRVLLDGGANVNADVQGYAPLHAAAGAGHAEAIRLLVTRGAVVDAHANTYRSTPLMAAVMGSHDDPGPHLEAAAALIAAGADIDAEDNRGWRVLEHAAWSFRHEEETNRVVNPVFRLLLEKGVDLTFIDRLEPRRQATLREKIALCRGH